MVTDHVRKTLSLKSKTHRLELKRLGQKTLEAPLSSNVLVLNSRPQVLGVNTILLDPDTDRENFIFYFDRMGVMLMEA